MITRYSLTSAPASEPVSLTEVKQQLRLAAPDEEAIYTDEDSRLNGFIKAAREQVEHICRRALITQTWTINLDGWPSGNEIVLPFPPLVSVTSVKYTDVDAVQTTFTDYSVDTGTPGKIVLDYGETWPSATLRPRSPIEIIFVAGYGASTAVPESIRQAILMLVGHLYENRESTTPITISEVPYSVNALLASYRWL